MILFVYTGQQDKKQRMMNLLIFSGRLRTVLILLIMVHVWVFCIATLKRETAK